MYLLQRKTVAVVVVWCILKVSQTFHTTAPKELVIRVEAMQIYKGIAVPV